MESTYSEFNSWTRKVEVKHQFILTATSKLCLRKFCGNSLVKKSQEKFDLYSADEMWNVWAVMSKIQLALERSVPSSASLVSSSLKPPLYRMYDIDTWWGAMDTSVIHLKIKQIKASLWQARPKLEPYHGPSIVSGQFSIENFTVQNLYV